MGRIAEHQQLKSKRSYKIEKSVETMNLKSLIYDFIPVKIFFS